MAKSQTQYEENKELLENYIGSHSSLKEFIYPFAEMQRAAEEHRETAITISIGENVEEGFFSYLKNSVKNPRVLFTSCCVDSKRIPQIIISDRAYTVMCFTLDDVRIISYKPENNNCTCPFDRYNFVVHNGKFDYDMTMVIYRKQNYTLG